MGSPTTNYGWDKPTVGGDANVWGTGLNGALDGIDSVMFGKLDKTGGTCTGSVLFNNQVNGPAATLTDGATISWNTLTAQVASVTLGGNRTMAAPTNLVNGGTYVLFVIQDGTGSRTLTWNAVFKWPGGTAPTLSTAANARDMIGFVSDGTNLYGGNILKALA